MMAQYGMIITNIGLAKMANAQITQDTVDAKYMVLGDGNGAFYTPNASQTALRREVWRGLLADMSVGSENPNRITFSAYLPSTVGGFTIREVGIIDDDGHLLALSLYPEQYKPQMTEGISDDILIHCVIETSNAGTVTLAVDPAIIIASRKYVDDKVAGVIGNIDTNLTELDEKVTQHLDQYATVQDVTYYVDAVNGDDSNSGASTSSAFKTLNKLISVLPRIINHVVTVNLAEGSYFSDLKFSGRVGEGYVYFNGNVGAINDVTIVGSFILDQNQIYVDFKGIRFLTEGTGENHVVRSMRVGFSHCLFAGVNVKGLRILSSNVQIAHCIFYEKNSAIVSEDMAQVVSINNEGGGSNGIALHAVAGTIIKIGEQPNATTAELEIDGGVIR